MQSMVPSASASRSACRSASRAQRRRALGRRVVAAAGHVGERQVVRRHLAGHRQAAPLGLAHRAHRRRRRDVRDVIARAGPAPPARGRAPPSPTRPPAAARAGRRASPPAPSFITPPCARFRSSACCTTGRPKVRAYSSARRIRSAFITGMPSSETATMPASFISPISASDSPLSPLEMAPIGQHAHDRRLARPPHDEVGHRAAVVGRIGVGHAADGGEAARRRRPRARGDVLFVLVPGLAQVHVQVDEAGRDHLAAAVDDPGARSPAARAPLSTALTTPSSIRRSVILSRSAAGSMTRPPFRRSAAGTPHVYRGAADLASATRRAPPRCRARARDRRRRASPRSASLHSIVTFTL